MEYPIGTKFSSRGKHPHICTVIDIHKTFNHAGELVKTRYVATHEFMGQTITQYDLPIVSIQLGEIK